METLPLSILPQENILAIAVDLPIDDLERFCRTSKEYRDICNDEYLWKLKVKKDFPDEVKYKSEGYLWKDYYFMLYYVSEVSIGFEEELYLKNSAYRWRGYINFLRGLSQSKDELNESLMNTDDNTTMNGSLPNDLRKELSKQLLVSLVSMTPQELRQYCLTNKRNNKICNNEYFWYLKTRKELPTASIPPNTTWRKFYQQLKSNRKI